MHAEIVPDQVYYYDLAAGQDGPEYIVTLSDPDDRNATQRQPEIPIYPGVRVVFNYIRVAQGDYNTFMAPTLLSGSENLDMDYHLNSQSVLAFHWPPNIEASQLSNVYYGPTDVNFMQSMLQQVVPLVWRDNRSVPLCRPCADGLFKDTAGNGACESCAAGQYRDAASQTCRACPAGTFSDTGAAC